MKYSGKSGKFALGPWTKGLNNVKGLEELGSDEVADSSNFFFDERGNARTRPGVTKKIAGINAQGLFGVTEFEGLFFDSGSLFRFDVRTWETVQIASGFMNHQNPVWVRLPDRVLFSNGTECGRVFLSDWSYVEGFGSVELGLPVSVGSLGFGNLAKGRYIFAVTFVNELGEESGCNELSMFELLDTGGIQIAVSGQVPAGWKTRFYATGAGGTRDELQRIAEVSGDNPSFQFLSNEFGSPLETLFLSEIYAPDLMALYNGYLFFAKENLVYCSEVMNYGLFHEDHGHVGTYPRDVSVLERGQNGIFVAADKTYAYVGSGPKEFELRDDVFNFPGVKYSGMQIDGRFFEGLPQVDLPFWFTTRGGVVGLPDGSVLALSKDQAEPDVYARGVSGLVQFNGQTSIVTAVDEKVADGDSIRFQDNFEVRVINRGITE